MSSRQIEVLSAVRSRTAPDGQTIRYAVYPTAPGEEYREREVFVPYAGPVAQSGQRMSERDLLALPEIVAGYDCRNCGLRFAAEYPALNCPDCGAPTDDALRMSATAADRW